MSAEALILARDPLDKTAVLAIRRVVPGLLPKDIQIQVEFHRVSGNLQILKARAEKAHRRHIADKGMLRRNLRDDAISRHHIEDIQMLNNGSG